jgi:hypothetical protein
MSDQPQPKTTLAALSLALGAIAVVCFGYGLIRFPQPVGTAIAGVTEQGKPVIEQRVSSQGLPHGLWVQLAGLIFLSGSLKIAERNQLNQADFDHAVGGAIAGLETLLWETVRNPFGKATQRKIQTIVVRSLPAPIKLRVDKLLANLQADDAIFDRFLEQPHIWLAGRTNAGKTFLMLALLTYWLQKNQDGVVTICDLSYGKPDRTPGDIKAAIADEAAEMRAREKFCAESQKDKVIRFQPRLFIVTELETTTAEIMREEGVTNHEKSEFLADLNLIARRAHALQIKLALDGQSVATGESKVSEASRQQFAIALLGDNTTVSMEVGKFGSSNSKELIEKATLIKSKNLRPVIMQLGAGQPQALIVPDLGWIRDLKFKHLNPPDPDLEWWESVWTEQTKQWLLEQASDHVINRKKSPLKTMVCDRFGVTFNDTRYKRFVSPAWAEVKSTIENRSSVK